MAGELITDDWQFEYRGVLLAKQEGYWIDNADGLDSLPDTRRDQIVRPRGDGSLVTPNYSDDRVVTLQMTVRGATHEQLRSRLDALIAATDLIETPEPFVYRLGGQPAQLVYCRPSARAIPTDRDLRVKVAHATIQLVAEDPLRYSAVEQSTSTGVGSTVGGFNFPANFPAVFGTATPGTLTAVNDGLAEAPWTAMLTGPLLSPKILHVGKQQALELNGFDLTAGQTLVFEQRTRTALLNGTASRSGSLTRRDWFTLSPGSNLIQLDAASGTGQLTLTWRSASK
jgi:hypothetical protein